MKTFADNAGRNWTVQINVDAIKRVRDLVSVNLLEVVEGKLLERLVSDPVLLCDCVYAVCKPEADTKGVSDVDFGRAMAGDAIDAATTALLEELVDFFPLARRKVLAKALNKLKALETAALRLEERRNAEASGWATPHQLVPYERNLLGYLSLREKIQTSTESMRS